MPGRDIAPSGVHQGKSLSVKHPEDLGRPGTIARAPRPEHGRSGVNYALKVIDGGSGGAVVVADQYKNDITDRLSGMSHCGVNR